MRKSLLIFSVCLLFASCGKRLYSYGDYNDAVYKYSQMVPGSKNETKDLKTVVSAYGKVVNPKQKRYSEDAPVNQVPPGANADYACLLYKQGDKAGAKLYFEKELKLYPESKTIVNKLKKELGLDDEN